MKPGITFKEICTTYSPSAENIDEKKLIRFGLLKGLIRRLQKYPVLSDLNSDLVMNQRGVYAYFDGNHSVDEICVKTGKSFSEIDEKISKHSRTVIIWK